jgi:hypothetical protein
MQYGALRGASFVVGATVSGGPKKDNKSSAKIKALFQKPLRIPQVRFCFIVILLE